MSAPPEPATIRRYLLGQLPEAEMARLEVAFLVSDEVFDEIAAVENELIDAHLDGHLSADEERQFERRFLSVPSRAQRIALARTLRVTVSRAPEAPAPPEFDGPAAAQTRPMAAARDVALPNPSGLRGRTATPWAGWAAAAVLTVAAAGQFVHGRALQAELRASAAASRARDDELERVRAEVAELRAQAARAAASLPALAAHVVTAVLREGASRDGGERSEVALPPGTEVLRLQLVLRSDDSVSYAAVVETAEGTRVASRRALASEPFGAGRAVTLSLDAGKLASGEYVVALEGLRPDGSSESVADYAFPLRRR